MNQQWAIPEPGTGTCWKWRCATCQARGYKGAGEQVAHWTTAVRNAMKHNMQRHLNMSADVAA